MEHTHTHIWNHCNNNNNLSSWKAFKLEYTLYNFIFWLYYEIYHYSLSIKNLKLFPKMLFGTRYNERITCWETDTIRNLPPILSITLFQLL